MNDIKFDIIGKRNWWFVITALLVIPGLISMAVQGFNLGIDFTGGTLVDIKFTRPVTVTEVRDILKDNHLENSTIQLAGDSIQSLNVLIRTRVLEEQERRDMLSGLEEKFGKFEVLRTEKVGAVIGSELTRQALIALALSWVIMVAYITYRFEFKFAISGIIKLVHDVLVVLGAFSLLRLEVDSSFVAALLTIVGYSINDAIVIFDRVRENLKSYRKTDSFKDLVNRSIWQTMTRSIYTVMTVLFGVIALYFFGGETTKNFALALIIGFSIGAYSSIFLASPLWVMLKEMAERKRIAERAKGLK